MPRQKSPTHAGGTDRLAPPDIRRALGFSITCIALWSAFYALHIAFPFVQPGSDLVYQAKVKEALLGTPFPESSKDALKVVIFGNSLVLSGFIPELFDTLNDHRVYSYNLGLPNSVHFVEELSAMIARGQAPDIVFVTVPWSTEERPSWTQNLMNDEWMLDRIAPFHRMVRDGVLFAIRARTSGGVMSAYAKARRDVERTLRARGYYFIEGQSHYPNHRLPDDFSTPHDNPERTLPRTLATRGPLFERLLTLTKTHGIHVYLVPTYLRKGAAAPAPERNETVIAQFEEYPSLCVIGPDYVLLENRYFSDHVHLNPEGADYYTRYLKELTGSIIHEHTVGVSIAGSAPPPTHSKQPLTPPSPVQAE